jgi:thiamine monophosphate kinase
VELREIADVAVIALFPPGADLVPRVDFLKEEVHSYLTSTSAHHLVRQALAVNLNDISAMGHDSTSVSEKCMIISRAGHQRELE